MTTAQLESLRAEVAADLVEMGRDDLEAVVSWTIGGGWPGKRAVVLVDRQSRRMAGEVWSAGGWRAWGRFDHTLYDAKP